MTPAANPNRPRKGDKIFVEPIRDLEHIKAIKKMLQGNPRQLLLFTIGINNGLRAGDILKLKVKDLHGKAVNETVNIKEEKTGKPNILMVNKTVHKAFKDFMAAYESDMDEYLFKSQKKSKDGSKKPWSVSYVNQLVKKWTQAINLKGNYGSHSLRKTFGYIQRKEYKVGFEVLCKRFNHSSPAVTMRYLGIDDKEVNGILKNAI